MNDITEAEFDPKGLVEHIDTFGKRLCDWEIKFIANLIDNPPRRYTPKMRVILTEYMMKSVEMKKPPTVSDIVYPVQCNCGHLFLEKYQLGMPNKNGEVGFCWCGFCRTKLMIKPIIEGKEAVNDDGHRTNKTISNRC